ncbi:MAG: hypothetical protein WCI79_02895 [Candidatus Saccharibacteria bacterium]
MINTIHSHIKRLTYNVGHFVTNSRTRRHIVSKFANKVGLVYFGTVNQHTDDHGVVRGFTVSQSHQDDHYSVGTIGKYNVSLVDRSDALWNADGQVSIQSWMIMAFELHTKQDLPHFFISARGHDDKPYRMFFTTFPTIHQTHLGTFEDYSPEFTSRYSLYARPNMAIQTERLIPPSAARVLSTHFWPLSVEQNEHVLYLYSSSQHVTLGLLETMLENGLWLAAHLDRQSELI